MSMMYNAGCKACLLFLATIAIQNVAEAVESAASADVTEVVNSQRNLSWRNSVLDSNGQVNDAVWVPGATPFRERLVRLYSYPSNKQYLRVSRNLSTNDGVADLNVQAFHPSMSLSQVFGYPERIFSQFGEIAAIRPSTGAVDFSEVEGYSKLLGAGVDSESNTFVLSQRSIAGLYSVALIGPGNTSAEWEIELGSEPGAAKFILADESMSSIFWLRGASGTPDRIQQRDRDGNMVSESAQELKFDSHLAAYRSAVQETIAVFQPSNNTVRALNMDTEVLMELVLDVDIEAIGVAPDLVAILDAEGRLLEWNPTTGSLEEYPLGIDLADGPPGQFVNSLWIYPSESLDKRDVLIATRKGVSLYELPSGVLKWVHDDRSEPTAASVAAGDIDGDGISEVITMKSDDETMQVPVLHVRDPENLKAQAGFNISDDDISSQPNILFLRNLLLADVTGDGVDEIVVTVDRVWRWSQVYVYDGVTRDAIGFFELDIELDSRAKSIGGSRILASHGRKISIVDLASRERTWTSADLPVSVDDAMLFGDKIVYVDTASGFNVLNVNNGELFTRSQPAARQIVSIAGSPVLALSDRSLGILNIESGDIVRSIQTVGDPHQLVDLEDGRVAVFSADSVELIDLDSGETVSMLPSRDFSPASRSAPVLVNSGKGKVILYRGENGLHQLQLDGLDLDAESIRIFGDGFEQFDSAQNEM